MNGKPGIRWVPYDVCVGLVEEAIRETLDGRFFKGTIEEVQHSVRRKVEELWIDLEEVDDDTCPHQA